jgi:hypothetical protein
LFFSSCSCIFDISCEIFDSLTVMRCSSILPITSVGVNLLKPLFSLMSVGVEHPLPCMQRGSCQPLLFFLILCFLVTLFCWWSCSSDCTCLGETHHPW